MSVFKNFWLNPFRRTRAPRSGGKNIIIISAGGLGDTALFSLVFNNFAKLKKKDETVTLLLLGIGCGAVCAVVAVLPHALINGLEPPIVEPLVLLVGIGLFGLCAGLAAVRRVSTMPLLESLRSH